MLWATRGLPHGPPLWRATLIVGPHLHPEALLGPGACQCHRVQPSCLVSLGHPLPGHPCVMKCSCISIIISIDLNPGNLSSTRHSQGRSRRPQAVSGTASCSLAGTCPCWVARTRVRAEHCAGTWERAFTQRGASWAESCYGTQHAMEQTAGAGPTSLAHQLRGLGGPQPPLGSCRAHPLFIHSKRVPRVSTL